MTEIKPNNIKKLITDNTSLVLTFFFSFSLLIFGINPTFMDNDDADMLAISHGLNGLTSNGFIYYQSECLKYIYQFLDFIPGIKGYWFIIILHFLAFKTYDDFLKEKHHLILSKNYLKFAFTPSPFHEFSI